jgi:uncharacterized protein (TIGR02271 family)
MLHIGRVPTDGAAPVRGTVDPADLARGGPVPLRLENGETVLVPREALRRQPDGTYVLAAETETPAEIREAGEAVVIPVVEETLSVRTQAFETGRVRITTQVHEREEVVDEAVAREVVEVQRVPVGRYVDAPVATRTEGDTTIIPVLEEVLVVEKRILLKEEVHVTRRRLEQRDPQRVTLRSEEVVVERTPPAPGGEG